jgi:transcriptional regulator with XRE-family HTH domain
MAGGEGSAVFGRTRPAAVERGSPTVLRRRVAAELRRLRQAAGLTADRVAAALEISTSKVSRIESGLVGATVRDVRDMLDLYGVTGPDREALLDMTRQARRKPWWHDYSDLPSSTFVGLEAGAASIDTYAALVVPSLLQTRSYTKACVEATMPQLTTQEIDRRLEFHSSRQLILSRHEPPTLWAVIDEGALLRLVGGPEVMREQLERLASAAAEPHVTLQVLPFSAGEHAGLQGPFTILQFAESKDLSLVHIENADNDVYLEASATIKNYATLFDHLRSAALKPNESVGYILQVVERL